MIPTALALLCLGVTFVPEPPRFVERPGELEFSGRVIVRPVEGRAGRSRIEPLLLRDIPATGECVVRVPDGESDGAFMARLVTTGDYEYVEPDWICHPTTTTPNDPSFSGQWHHQKIRSPAAWDIVTGAPAIVVAIVDGGVATDHPDLAPALVSGYNAADQKPQATGGDVYDVDGHGTFIAGCAAAIGNNGVDVVGVGWNLSIMPVRYYNSPGGGFLSDLLDGARWAVDHGAHCVNVSQTGVENNSVQTTGAYVRAKGGLLIWAAGNAGQDLAGFDWPDVVVVGGTDQNDALLSNSSVTSAHGLATDVYAPGADILSTFVNSSGVLGLGIGSGTSASTGIASGLCALIWSTDPSMTSYKVEAFLRAGCEDLGPSGEDVYWGHGRIDARCSLLTATSVYGDGCPGSAGLVPTLAVDACAAPGDPVTLSISRALGGATAWIFPGLWPAAAPMGFGCTLNVFPLLPAVGPLPLGGAAPGTGNLEIIATLPNSLPPTAVTMQAFVVDGGAPGGFSSSRGATLTIE